MKIVITAIVSIVLTALAARHRYYQEPAEERVTQRVIESGVLGEERALLVHLPESYEREQTRRYPVLYVLDGASHASHTAESARLMARIGVMPEVIVVGVPNGGDERRERDYTPPPSGQANRFLSFLKSELIPHIDGHYRTTPTRMLAGNSRGGLFVVYSLVEAPELFSARFAFSPALWRDDERIVSELAAALPAQPTFLYLSLGDGETGKMRHAFENTTALLKRSATFQWHAEITAGATHQTNATLSTPVGLHRFFGGLRAPDPRAP